MAPRRPGPSTGTGRLGATNRILLRAVRNGFDRSGVEYCDGYGSHDECTSSFAHLQFYARVCINECVEYPQKGPRHIAIQSLHSLQTFEIFTIEKVVALDKAQKLQNEKSIRLVFPDQPCTGMSGVAEALAI